MTEKTYFFSLSLVGRGENIQEAWEDATVSFALEPGDPEDCNEVGVEEDEDGS